AAELEGHAVRLRWVVAEGAGIQGFQVLRAEGDSDAYAALWAERRPMTGEGDYEAVDDGVEAGRQYRYVLEVVREGRSERLGPVEVRVPESVKRLAWRSAQPNPSGDSVQLELDGARAGVGSVAV